MEQKLPIVAKKFWNIVRVLFYMLRKSINKGKLLADLNMMLKRGKIAGKAIQNLISHHSQQFIATASATAHRSHDAQQLSFPVPLYEYEFSCSNTPNNFHLPFHLNKRKHNHHFNIFPSQPTENDMATMNAVVKALEMIQSEAASPALPGFGRSPMVRQLRITDSPFPLRDVEEDSHVDEAAEKFIKKFYKDLRRQNISGSPYLGYS